MDSVRTPRGCYFGLLSFAIAVFLVFSSVEGHAQTTTVPGLTPTSFRVNESGAATHTLPIQVPPGIAGMEPKLALTYNSKGGNGQLGMGWGLSGLSAITRCPRTLVQDGAKIGVNFSSSDRFCLDGQRLVMVSGSSYGADGTEYRTERETFTKIISNGVAGGAPADNGPAWFKVWTKSGQILEYGNTPDSSIQAQGKGAKVRVYALNKISDTKGNYLTILYTKDTVNFDFYPSEIAYNYSGAAANAFVRFAYDSSRADATPLYISGSMVKTVNRLTNVRTYVGSSAGATLVRDYRLAYEYGATTGRSRLTSVTECDTGGNCLQPTRTTWQEGNGPVNFSSAWSNLDGAFVGNTFSNEQYLVGDINGDGRADLVWVWNTADTLYRVVYLSNPDGSGYTKASSQTEGSFFLPSQYENQVYQLADVNGDGVPDLIWTWNYQDQLGRVVWMGNTDGTGFPAIHTSYYLESGFAPHSAGSCCPVGYRNQTYLTGDINGDGRADLVWVWTVGSQVGRVVWLANADGSGFPATYTSSDLENNYSPSAYVQHQFHLVDVNGDGKADLVWNWIYPPDDRVAIVTYVPKDDGTGFTYSNTTYQFGFNSTFYVDHHFLFGDVNGDGKADMVWTWYYAPSQQLGIVLFLANGDGTYSYSSYNLLSNWSPDAYSNKQFQLDDVNGDGKADLIWAWNYQDQLGRVIWTATPTGTDFALASYDLQSGWSPSAYTAQGYIAADVTGDGKSDLRWVFNYAGNLYQVLFKGPDTFPDLLTSLTTSLGAVTSIAYKPLTDSSVYAKFRVSATVPQPPGVWGSIQYSASTGDPVIDIQPPFYVAASTNTSDGIGGNYLINYTYAGLKAHLQGGGLLGFAYMTAADAQTGISTTTAFRQDYPFQGLPNGISKFLSGSPFDQVLNSWTTTPTPNATGQYHRCDLTYSSETITLDGVSPRTVTTTSAYNAFGNTSSTTVSTSDGFTKATTNTYATPDTVNWLVGRLVGSQVTSTTP